MAEPKPYPIIDSHIHLYPSSEISQLAWNTDTSSPLHAQQSIAEYKTATSTPKNLEGFIFLETDRINDLSAGESGWEFPLKEIDFLARIINEEPRDGEGHSKGDGQKCLGIVPWAPIPSGEEAMKRYVEIGKERVGEKVWGRVKGFRYLVQDKPRGTLLGEGFVEALRWMGREGYVFDLGVDQHRGGKWQLEEALECIGKAREEVKEGDVVKVVVSELFLLILFLDVWLLAEKLGVHQS
jgi:L-rhamnono-1,4-lactonase